MVLGRNICVAMAAIGIHLISSFDASSCLQYTVGDSVWSIPPYPLFYINWSSSNVFYSGDSLVFEFESELFNVIQVTKLEYESCSSISPLTIQTDSPAIVLLREEGVFYYICNISNYCYLGQKISVVVQKHKNSPSLQPQPPPPSLPSRGEQTNQSQLLPPPPPPPTSMAISDGGSSKAQAGLVMGFTLCLWQLLLLIL